MKFRALVLLLISLWIPSTMAAIDKKEEYVAYIELKAFTANFGNSQELHFVKCEITIQVGSLETELLIENHKDAIRNDILFLLMGQSVESMMEPIAQKILSKKAILLIKQRLVDEEGDVDILISDLFFVSFVAQ